LLEGRFETGLREEIIAISSGSAVLMALRRSRATGRHAIVEQR